MTTLADYDFVAIGLFRATLSAVEEAVQRLNDEKPVLQRYEHRSGPLEIASIYERRPPRGGAHAKRAVFFEPASAPGTTAFVANLEDGWFTLFNVLSSRVPREHVFVRSSDSDDYPIGEFRVCSQGRTVRYVRAMREDPSWEFLEKGDPQLFEDLGHYKNRRIAKRLDREILVSYLRRLGWDLTEAAFWTTLVPAFYLSAGARPHTDGA